MTPNYVNFIYNLDKINKEKIKKISYRKATRKLYLKNKQKKLEANLKHDLENPEKKKERRNRYSRSERGKLMARLRYKRNKEKMVKEGN
jgi:hypothetical protein